MDINNAFGSPFGQIGSIGKIVSVFINTAFVLAGIILLIFFIIGGIGMISGAGSSDAQKLEQGKKAATSALIGFIIVFASYWIVKLIQQITGIQIL